MVEHFADGDVFDASASTGRWRSAAANLAQWGRRCRRTSSAAHRRRALVGASSARSQAATRRVELSDVRRSPAEGGPMSIALVRYAAGAAPRRRGGRPRRHPAAAARRRTPPPPTCWPTVSTAARDLLADMSAAPPMPLRDVTVLQPGPAPGAGLLPGRQLPLAHDRVRDGPGPRFNMLFTKSTASLSRPGRRHRHPAARAAARLRGRARHRARHADHRAGHRHRRATLAEYVGAFVVANDVSARDVQLPQGQWYKGKSYRTFCPVGPYLCVPGRRRGGPLARAAAHAGGERRAAAGRARAATWCSARPRR